MEDNFDLRLLDPKGLTLFMQGGLLRLTHEEDRSYLRVMVVRAYPLSDPNHYWGLLDGDGKDIGMIVSPDELASDSRALAEQELEKRYFVPIVEKVIEAKEDFGTTVWEVETNRGRKRYMVRGMKDNMIELSSTRIILTDVDGNRFEIPDIRLLDGKSLGLIMRGM
jgi:hypothetical protein